MANIGKYIDRSPNVIPAGFMKAHSEHVIDALQAYSIEEGAEDILRRKHKINLVKSTANIILPTNSIHEVLTPDFQRSRFTGFRDRFMETLFFPKAEVGNAKSLGLKPAELNNENYCYGDTIVRSEPVYEVIFPKKDMKEINREYNQFHDKHIISHNHYYPSERINRKYNEHFNPKDTFGDWYNVDPYGGKVEKLLDDPNHLLVVNKTDHDLYRRTKGRLGKSKEGLVKFPLDKVFGKKVVDPYSAQSLMETMDPNLKKTDLINALSHLTYIRRKLFERFGSHIHELISQFLQADVEKKGYLSLCEIVNAGESLYLHMNANQLRILLKHFNLIGDPPCENVNYYTFYHLCQISQPLPPIGNLSGMPPHIQNKDTMYREFCEDRKKPSNTDAVAEHRKATGKIDPYVTTTKDLIQREIPMDYGLTPDDFNEKRPKAQLKIIFKKVLKSEEEFENVWQAAFEKSNGDGMISVNNMTEIMYENYPVI